MRTEAGTRLLLAAVFPLILSLACGAFASAEELRCLDGSIRTETEGGRVEESKASYCTDRAGLRFVEKSCQASLSRCVRGIVQAAPAPTADEPRIKSQFGSPGFKRCSELGGEGRFVEIESISGRTRAALCFFKDGKTFLDHDTLFGLTRELRR